MSSPKRDANIGELLKKALTKLNQNDHFDEYMRYLNAEWYYTPDDLRRAREDERVWAELKFPGRLKVEISALLDESVVEPDESHEVSSKVQFSDEANTTTTFELTTPDIEEAEYNSWVKCWAPEHECYYFYNTITQASSWEDPYGADETAVYDVYQYNEETQEWAVIEDNTSGYSYDDAAESKNSGSERTFEDKQSSAEGAAVTFTRPRDPNSDAEMLFALSPNRPGAKGVRSDSKAHYRYSARGAGGGGRGIPSPSGSPVPARKNKPKPVRLDVTNMSDDSGSDKESPAKPRSGEKSGVKSAAVVGAAAVSGVKSSGGEKRSESKGEFSYVTPRSDEPQALEKHRSSSLDSDAEYPVRHAGGIYTTGTAEVESSYQQSAYTEGSYNDDGTYNEGVDENGYTQAENEAYYNSYDANDPSSKSYYDHNTDTYYTNGDSKDSDDADPDYYLSATQGGVQSGKSNATRSSKFSEYGYEGDYSTAASSKREEDVVEESFYHHAAEPTAPATPLPDKANKYSSHTTHYRANNTNTNNATNSNKYSNNDSPTDDVHIIGLPVVAPSPQLYTPNGRTRRYSNDEKSDSRSTSVTYATPVRADDPTGNEENYFYATSVEDFPITPGGTNNVALMQVAMGTPVTPHTPQQQSPHPTHTKTKHKSTLGKLFHMNLFSKGSKMPSTPPPPRDNRSDNNHTAATNPHSSAYRQARQEERRSNKNNANSNKNGDIVITTDTNTSTNKGNKMRPFPSTSTSNPHNNNNTLSDKTANYNSPSNPHNNITHPDRNTNSNNPNNTNTNDTNYYTNAHSGDRQDLGMRRKPAPAAADSAASVASNDKFYEHHGNEKQYKYQNKQRELNNNTNTNASGNRKPTSALQEEVHLQNLQTLMDMGFGEGESIMALNMCEDNLTEATQMLVDSRG